MSASASASPVLVIGSMALDDLHLPSGSFENVVGGAATFASVAASLFAPAQIVGVVGSDFPEATLTQLGARNIDCAGVERVSSGKTFKWVGKYADNLGSRETLDTQLNVFADFSPKLPAHFKKTKTVLLGNIHPALQLDVLSQLEPDAFVVADTMNYWISSERPLLTELLTKINLLTINDEELRELSGIHNIRQAARKVLTMGPKRLIVKKGEHGALLFDGDRIAFVPAYPLETELDPTGAGDSFAGSLLGRLAQLGKTDTAALTDALVYATAVASFNVEGVGMNRLLTITTADVAARIAEVRAIAQLGG